MPRPWPANPRPRAPTLKLLARRLRVLWMVPPSQLARLTPLARPPLPVARLRVPGRRVVLALALPLALLLLPAASPLLFNLLPAVRSRDHSAVVRRGREKQEVVVKYGGSPVPARDHRPNGDNWALGHIKRSISYSDEYNAEVKPEQEQFIRDMASEDVEVRRAAAKLLWERKYPFVHTKTKEALFAALLDEDFQVRYDASMTMVTMLEHSSQAAIRIDPYVARMAQKLTRNTTLPEHKVCYAEGFSRMGLLVRPYSYALGKNLLNDDPRVRYACLQAYQAFGTEWKVYRADISLLRRDEHEPIRKLALHILDTLNDNLPLPRFMENQKHASAWRIKKRIHMRGRKKRTNGISKRTSPNK